MYFSFLPCWCTILGFLSGFLGHSLVRVCAWVISDPNDTGGVYCMFTLRFMW